MYLHLLPHLTFTTKSSEVSTPILHFVEEETKVHRGQKTCPSPGPTAANSKARIQIQVCLAPQPESPSILSHSLGVAWQPPTMAAHPPYLHYCVVDGDKVGEQVQVPGGEDKSEKDLALPGDACSRMGDRRQ